MKATPEMIAAAWGAWKTRHGGKLGPGPAFVEAIEAALAATPASGMRAALERQGDNMAFVLNHVGLPDQYYEKFTRELAEDRAALNPESK